MTGQVPDSQVLSHSRRLAAGVTAAMTSAARHLERAQALLAHTGDERGVHGIRHRIRQENKMKITLA